MMTMCRILTALLITVVYKTELSNGYPSAKYTWPLSHGNPLLQINDEVTEGKLGCSVTQGSVHPSLQYSGIYVTSSSTSYVDVTVPNWNQFEDHSFAVFAKPANDFGGTVLHYKQDDSAVDLNIQMIKDVIMWLNQSHLIIETLGPNDENYGYGTYPLQDGLTNTWVGFAVSYDFSKPEIKLMTSTGISTEFPTLNDAVLGIPGSVRVGASFYSPRPSLEGNVICLNMYDAKLNTGDFSNARDECDPDNWNGIAVPPPTSQTCGDLKGYFEIKQSNSALDSSITSVDTMVTPSRVKCADLCMRKETCSSFTIDGITGVCKLFDADYSSNMVSSPGTHYYLTRDICC